MLKVLNILFPEHEFTNVRYIFKFLINTIIILHRTIKRVCFFTFKECVKTGQLQRSTSATKQKFGFPAFPYCRFLNKHCCPTSIKKNERDSFGFNTSVSAMVTDCVGPLYHKIARILFV